MTEKGLRCVVELQLKQVIWDDQDGASLRLKGGPVFLRVCLMGQLEYSELKVPAFPVSLEQTLKFERIYTNCRDPSLIQEVMRGEHVRIELVQVNDDYKGGKIVARFEDSVTSFLFPSPTDRGHDSSASDTGRNVALNKSRKYQNPPVLYFDTNLSTSEALIQSAVDMIWSTTTPQQSSTSASGRRTANEAAGLTPAPAAAGLSKTPTRVSVKKEVNSTTSRANQSQAKHDSILPSERKVASGQILLHSDADSDSESSSQYSMSKMIDLPESDTVMGFPRVPTPEKRPKIYSSYSCRNAKVVYSPRNQPVKSPAKPTKSTSKPTKSTSKPRSSVQPHCRESHCPRKSILNSSGQSFKAEQGKPAFVVRHSDKDLLSRRNFPKPLPHNVHHSSTTRSPNPRLSANGTKSALDLHTRQQTASTRASSPSRYDNCRTLSQSERNNQPVIKSPKKTMNHSSHPDTGPSKTVDEQSVSARRPVHIYLHSEEEESESDLLTEDSFDRLRSEPGNLRQPRVDSPSRALREKISDLMEKCGEHEHNADSVGEDDSSVDEQRLRSSLAAERNLYSKGTSRHGKPSVTVRVGEDDYWSSRMAEFTGKPNRVVFDETLEKIYGRLYNQAQKTK